jgi:hypothetical protein
MRTYKLTPNLSLEATPIWSFFYDKPGYKKYQQAGKFMRRLSSLNLSLGTIQFDTTRQVAIAAKINLFSQKDFYADKALGEIAYTDLKPMRDTLAAQIDRLRESEKSATTDAEKVAIDYQVFQLEQQLLNYDLQIKERTNTIRNIYMRRFWNAASLDLCFGKSYSYFSEVIDSLKLQNRGFGVWLTGGIGIGKSGFVSGIVKYVQFSSETFSWQRGLNFRYGGLRYHFFIEGVAQTDESNVLDVNTGMNRLQRSNTINIGYGGAFRIGSNLLLSFGIRTIYDNKLNFNSLLPIANLSCLMR